MIALDLPWKRPTTRLTRSAEIISRRIRAVRIGPFLIPLITLCLLTAGLFAFSHNPHNQFTDSPLTAHEWGTFTSIAGNDGQAVEWLPQNGSTDLPQFVEHLEGADFKRGLRGTVRMETPVIYFYSLRPMTVSVHVAFRNGLITEWYPRVSKATPGGDLRKVALSNEPTRGDVWWNSVQLEPASAPDFPKDEVETHYYAARETSSTPLRITGNFRSQHEKFLFYRGVADFRVPLSVVPNRDGNLDLRNQGTAPIPSVIVFERRGERVGYQINGPLQTEITLLPPELTSSVDALRTDLEDLLVNQGLYPDEAHAVVETWRDSWFQQGTRIFYIVPESFVNSILPLTINPMPSHLSRVFVGRVEVVTPRTEREIETALARRDAEGLDRFGRFLFPILQVMMDRNPDRAQQIQASLTALER